MQSVDIANVVQSFLLNRSLLLVVAWVRVS